MEESIQKWLAGVKGFIRTETIEEYRAKVLDDIKFIMEFFKIDQLTYEIIEVVLKSVQRKIH